MSRSVAGPSGSTNEDSTQSASDNSDPNDILARLRRRDSIAWLIQGDDACGAVTYHKGEFIVATNGEKQSDHAKTVLKYLSDTAKESYKISQKLKQSQNYNQITKLIKKKLSEIVDILLLSEVNVKIMGKDYRQKDYYENFNRSLFKLTFTLIFAFMDREDLRDYYQSENFTTLDRVAEQSLKIYKKNAVCHDDTFLDTLGLFCDMNAWIERYAYIKEGDRLTSGEARILKDGPFNFVSGKVHAELKIVQALLDKYCIIDSTGSIDNSKIKNLKQSYVGVSKACCLNCECSIKAVNEVLRGHGLKNDFIGLRKEEGSDAKFPSVVPGFLKSCPELKEAFLNRRGVKNLDKAFSESQTNSEGKLMVVGGRRMRQKRSRKRSKEDKNKGKEGGGKHRDRSRVKASSEYEAALFSSPEESRRRPGRRRKKNRKKGRATNSVSPAPGGK